ncbi:matrixin family metalloprotease [Arthrobacter sp. 162MFSha1.1]|uniref:matrixin family metalloprotease n=1 Tax=Arthrobacter sp. 162MFSha1.1 TaxID=1151119 RepID=UPI0003AA9FEB|nr:matrixin family metalloprotease [Arthrobacter sp. 162MFSha1.1]
MSRATGLVFIDDGATDEPGGFKRKPYQPERYGDRWAPVLIAWVDPSELSGDAGQGNSLTAKAFDGNSAYVTGELDVSVLPNYDNNLERAVLEHELGHLVGLAHDDDGDELMNSVAVHQKYEYQPGDLAGLAILGQGKCLGV